MVAAAAIFAVAGRLLPAWYGYGPVLDDAYYYLVTAHNYVSTGILSFDRINPTNGFHPLWMWLLILALKPAGAGAGLDLQVFILTALEATLFLLAVFAAWRFRGLTQRSNEPWATGFLFLLIFYLSPFGDNYFTDGMESALSLLALTLAVGFFLLDRPLPLSASLMLLFLARLDSLIFFILPLLVFAWWTRYRHQPRKAVAIGLPTLIAFVAYTINNYISFGHLEPIGGKLKSSFPLPTPHFSFLLDLPARILMPRPAWIKIKMLLSPGIDHLAVSMVVIIVLLLLLRPVRPVRAKLLALTAILFSMILNLLLFQKWDKGIEPWYLAMPLVVSFLLLGSLAGEGLGRLKEWKLPLKKITPLALGLLLAWQAFFAGSSCLKEYSSRERGWLDPKSVLGRDSLVGFLIHHTAPDDIIATTDAGIVGFWSQRRVVNLDGLINNFEYQEYLRAGRLREYLREKGVRYLRVGWQSGVQPFRLLRTDPMYRSRVNPAAFAGGDYPPADFYVYSYLYNRFSDRIPLCPGQEVFRSAPFTDGGVKSVTVLYDLTRPCGNGTDLRK